MPDEIITEEDDGWEATVVAEGHGVQSPVSPLDRPSMWRNEPLLSDHIIRHLRDIQSELAGIKAALCELSKHLGVREDEW